MEHEYIIETVVFIIYCSLKNMKSIKFLSTFLLIWLFAVNANAVEGARITYSNGLKIEVPEAGFDVKINTEINVSYSYTTRSNHGGEMNSFDPYRERLTFLGNILNKKVSYYLQYKFAGTNLTAFDNDDARAIFGKGKGNRDESASLSEAWIQYNVEENFQFRLGRQKLQFGIVQPAGMTKLQFITRPLAYQVFGELYKYIPSTDAGATGYYNITVDNNVLTTSFGVFNDAESGDRNTSVATAANINYAANGFDRTTEGDVKYTTGIAWTAGLSALYNKVYTNEDAYDVGLDFALKSSGFSLQMEGFLTYLDSDKYHSSDNYGYYIQTGYFFVPKTYEGVLRFSGVALDKKFGLNPSSESYEYSAAINRYILGHNLKLQGAFSYYTLDGNNKDQDAFKFILGVSANL